MAELVVELRSEEIPARMQARAAEDLKRLMEQGLEKAGLSFDSVVCFATPRRLALMAFNLPERQPDVEEEKRGPREGAPEQAIQGFLKGNGLESLEQAELRDTGKGNFWFAVKKIEGRATREVLPEILESAIRALPWPKSMRWGEGEFRWVRPLRSITAVFEGKALAGGLDLGGGLRLDYQDEAKGHPFMGDKPFKVTSFEDYNRGLGEGYVILLPGVRRELIKKLAEEAAGELGLTLKEDEALLDEVTGLAEWPQLVVGRIEPEFMELPPEVLTTSMRSHQKYFALETPEGTLAPYFLVVTDIESLGETQRRKNIIAGNERVLRARLSDARFFWDQDRKRSLQSRVSDLKQVVFHAKLGTVEDKIDRITSLAVSLAKHIEGSDVDRVRSAARLAKADLTTGMVGEFPELQGIMGRYYALADGEHDDVAEAVAEHYSPLGPNDACPSAPTSVAVALADKLDTLAGFWAIDEKPTGSKDPYALRRAALGVIRLVVENELRFDLATEIASAAKPHIERCGIAERSEYFGAYQLRENDSEATIEGALAWDLFHFLLERLRFALKDQGIRHDVIAAAFATKLDTDLVRVVRRAQAVQQLLDSPEGDDLLVANRRARNIVEKEEADFTDAPDER
ncbi:glycine--tRNA ligase subunit beta, partial [Limibacillus halophilus]